MKTLDSISDEVTISITLRKGTATMEMVHEPTGLTESLTGLETETEQMTETCGRRLVARLAEHALAQEIIPLPTDVFRTLRTVADRATEIIKNDINNSEHPTRGKLSELMDDCSELTTKLTNLLHRSDE